MDDALKNSFSIEDWYVNGLAVIDYDKFQTLSDKEKESEVFNIILVGLKDIATIDKLDMNIIDNVANTIKENGKETELHFKTIENGNFKLLFKKYGGRMSYIF